MAALLFLVFSIKRYEKRNNKGQDLEIDHENFIITHEDHPLSLDQGR